MAKKVQLAWFDLDVEMFPENVQTKVLEVHLANAALSKAIAELPETVAQKAAIEAANKAILPFVDRIQVPVMVPSKNAKGESVMVPHETDKVKILTPGHTVELGYRWDKLSIAAKPISKKAKSSGAVLA